MTTSTTAMIGQGKSMRHHPGHNRVGKLSAGQSHEGDDNVKSSMEKTTPTSTTSSNSTSATKEETPELQLHRSEGIFAVYKPAEWTSNDVVSFLRCRLEEDARSRGLKPKRVGRGSGKDTIKVGHGGTLDPDATGVLVVGVGRGTKELQTYLQGSKRYLAVGVFGHETTTLDSTGEIVKEAATDHITPEALREALKNFVGKIQQVPPIYSAIRQNRKRLYEKARSGSRAEDIDIPPREVEVYQIELIDHNLPYFTLNVECGGGTYIRSLIRDIGYQLNSVATMTSLERTQQGQFTVADCLQKDHWNVDMVYAEVDRVNQLRKKQT